LPSLLTAELGRLFRAGFSLLPLGGDDGKKPIVGFKDRSRLPLALVLDRMAGAGSKTFGIRLAGLLVVDVDTDTPEARAYVEQRFGTSSASTKTSRGFHLYFRHDGPKPSTVDLPGIRIDFKAGGNEFVVGAYSERPDGTIYRALGRLVSASELPWFEDRGAVENEPDQPKVNGRFPVGCRRTTLKRRAHQLAVVADTFDNLLADLLGFRDWEIERPEDFPDAEISKLAVWFWDLRERGQLWNGRNSAVLIQRSAIDLLAKSKSRNKGLAMLLFNILSVDQGNSPDAFAIVPDGLRQSGRLVAGRRQIYDALDLLLELRLVICRKRPRGNRNHYLYQLGDGRQEGEEGERGGGSILILVSDKDTHSGGLAA